MLTRFARGRRPGGHRLGERLAVLGSDPLQALRAYFTDALLPAIYTRDGVRVVSNVVGVWDDARCSSPVGRAFFPGIATENLILNPNLSELNGQTKVSVVAWVAITQVTSGQGIVSRSGSNAQTGQFSVYISGGGKIVVEIADGAAVNTATGSTVLAAGKTYKISVVYDGTQAAANRVKIYLATRNADGSYTADAAEALTISGTIPASLIAGLAIAGYLGSYAGNQIPLFGWLDEFRLWTGTALSAAQVAAETLASNAVPALYRLSFDVNSYQQPQTGTADYFAHCTMSQGIVICSDDLRWGPALYSSGTARPAWNSALAQIECDNTDDQLDSYPLAVLDTSTDTGIAVCATDGNVNGVVASVAPNAALAGLLAITMSGADISAWVTGAQTVVDSGVPGDTTTPRTIVASCHATSGRIAVPGHAAVTAAIGAQPSQANCQIAINHMPGLGSRNGTKLRALVVGKRDFCASASDIAALDAFMASFGRVAA